jgi:hypothetical protein
MLPISDRCLTQLYHLFFVAMLNDAVTIQLQYLMNDLDLVNLDLVNRVAKHFPHQAELTKIAMKPCQTRTDHSRQQTRLQK